MKIGIYAVPTYQIGFITRNLAMIPCIRHLKDIHCEVLVICGEKDKANKSASSQLAQLIPNAKAITIAGAGHEVNIDCPAKLGKELEKFF